MDIGALGFPADQLSKLEKILKLSPNKRYDLVEFDSNRLPDLLLLFGEEMLQAPLVQALPNGFHARLIIVAKRAPADGTYAHLSFPLVSSRVLRALDLMTHENEEYHSAEQSAAAVTAESRFSKYVEQARQAVAADPAPEKGRRRVLIVDDSVPMQQALAAELQQLPQPVTLAFADCGEAALSLVADNDYDFIFLDIMMPGIDGFETCSRMRAMAKLKKTPIIMLSAKTSPLDEVKGIMAGCSTYLTKPIDHGEFQKVIKRVSNWIDEFQKA